LMISGAALERHRKAAKTWSVVRYPQGTQKWLPESCLLEVLAAYFRLKGWRLTQTQTGLFAAVAYVVLPQGVSDFLCVGLLTDDACGRCGKPRSVRFSKSLVGAFCASTGTAASTRSSTPPKTAWPAVRQGSCEGRPKNDRVGCPRSHASGGVHTLGPP
jgi:uncharacterized membrane protein YkvA (DUF1232 family)